MVYMVVDKKIELEVKFLKDYPEWEFLPASDLDRKSIQIFFDLKIAKRNCLKDKKVINSIKCKKAIKLAKEMIKNKGRLLVRPSGTEPKVRIMCETFNRYLMNNCIDIVKKTIH